jgi:hypothetical protein
MKKINIFTWLSIYLSLALCFPAISSGVFVKVSKPRTILFSEKLIIPAKCEFLNSRDYKAISNGVIDKISAGSDFNKGDVIIAYDLEQTKANLEMAKADFSSAKLNYERDTKLFAAKIISDEKFERSKVQYLASKAKYEEILRISEYKIITAEKDCKASTAKLKISDPVAQGDYLATIYYSNDKILKFIIPAKYKLSSTLSNAIVSTKNKTYNLEKLEISNVLPSDMLGYQASAIILGENDLEHNDLYNVELNYNFHEGLSVPENSVIISEGKSYIFITRDKKTAQKIEISQGSRKNGFVEVNSASLTEDSYVISEGFQKLTNNQEIQISQD